MARNSTPLTVVGKVADKNKSAALEAAMGQIDRAFGKGAVMKLGDKSAMDVASVSTGSLGLDIALGIGGLPRGRIIEIYGPESSGKTTLSLHCVAEIQKEGGVAAFIDAEHALDPTYAAKLGVDVNELLIAQPDTGEQGLEIADTLVRSGAIDVLVIDSVAALTPRAELEGDMGDSLPGLQARLMSQALRKLTGSISKSGCMVIFINQIRMKIGVMYGSPETTTGGNALKFYSSVRLDIRRLNLISCMAKASPKQVNFSILALKRVSSINQEVGIVTVKSVLGKAAKMFVSSCVKIQKWPMILNAAFVKSRVSLKKICLLRQKQMLKAQTQKRFRPKTTLFPT